MTHRLAALATSTTTDLPGPVQAFLDWLTDTGLGPTLGKFAALAFGAWLFITVINGDDKDTKK